MPGEAQEQYWPFSISVATRDRLSRKSGGHREMPIYRRHRRHRDDNWLGTGY